jgi:hypothetical protein
MRVGNQSPFVADGITGGKKAQFRHREGTLTDAERAESNIRGTKEKATNIIMTGEGSLRVPFMCTYLPVRKEAMCFIL